MPKRQRTFSREGLHFFQLHAHARRGHEGAYINCWIDFRLGEGALALAKYYVRREGWIVRSVKEHRWFDGPAEVSGSGRKYFREAKKDGASFVFNRYDRRAKRARARAST